MAKRMVICVECGRRFDAEVEGARYDPSSRRYTCMDCAKKEEEYAARRRIENAGKPDFSGVKKQKPLALILKLFFGVVCVCVCFSKDMEFGARILALVVGLALLAWAAFPFYKGRKAVLEAKARQQAEIDRQAAEAERLANVPKVCPACGAQTKGDKCEYCGSPLNG